MLFDAVFIHSAPHRFATLRVDQFGRLSLLYLVSMLSLAILLPSDTKNDARAIALLGFYVMIFGGFLGMTISFLIF